MLAGPMMMRMGARADGWSLTHRVSSAWVIATCAVLVGGCSAGSAVARDSDVGRDSGGGNARDASPSGDVDDGSVDDHDAANPDAGVADAHSEDVSGPVDAPPLDDASEADAATSCAGLFCEDFETGTLDPNIWSLETGGGQTVAIEDQIVAHGKHSVHFHIPPDVGTYGFIVTKGAPAALRSHYFGRASFYVTPRLPVGNEQLVIAGNGTFPDFDHFFVAASSLGWMQKVLLTNSVAAQEETWLHRRIPETRWACLEWEMNDVPGHTTLFIDGVVIDSYAIRAGHHDTAFGGFAEFAFGYYASQPNNGPVVPYSIDVYYDDIVLNTDRIGCL